MCSSRTSTPSTLDAPRSASCTENHPSLHAMSRQRTSGKRVHTTLSSHGSTSRARESCAACVGSFTSLSEDAEFIPGGNHRTDWISTFPFRYAFQLPGSLEDGHPSSKGDIIVGNDVWIGGGARILSGVTIGHGAVIGAGAVVT